MFEEMKKEIGLIASQAIKLQERIHKAGVRILTEWFRKNITCDQAAELLNALQAASPYHSNAFAHWVKMFTVLIWNDKDKCWVAPVDATIEKAKVMSARDNPFWKVKPASPPKPLNLLEEIGKLISKAEKHMKDRVEGDEVSLDLLNALREVKKAA